MHYPFKQSKYGCFIDFWPPEPLPAPLTARLSGAGDGAGAEAGDPRPPFFDGARVLPGPVEALPSTRQTQTASEVSLGSRDF